MRILIKQCAQAPRSNPKNNFQQNVIKHKVGLLNLAVELGNVSRACKVMGLSRDTENVLFIAISGDSQPHFTTLAAFVCGMNDSVAKLFARILLICDRRARDVRH